MTTRSHGYFYYTINRDGLFSIKRNICDPNGILSYDVIKLIINDFWTYLDPGLETGLCINMKGVAERSSVFASEIFPAMSPIPEEPLTLFFFKIRK